MMFIIWRDTVICLPLKYDTCGAFTREMLQIMLTEKAHEELTEKLPPILTIQEAANIFLCSPSTIRDAIKDGQLKAYIIPEDRSRWQINKSDLLEFLDKNSNQ